ncbi:MAG: PAS domain S-box protein [Nitrospirota bacterium]|nr:PAS domain S-box protein [Nitrospirota bacterium]
MIVDPISRVIGAFRHYCKGITCRLTILLLVLSLGPLLIAGVASFKSGRASLEQAIGAQLELRAERVLKVLEKLLTDGQQATQSWAKLRVMYDMIGEDPDGRITGTLIDLAHQTSGIGEIVAVSRQGIVVAASHPSRIGEKVAEQSWFRHVQAQDPFRERRIESMPSLEGGTFYISAPLLSQGKNPNLIGYLVASLPIEQLAKTVAGFGQRLVSEGQEIYVKTVDGQLMVSPSLSQGRPMTGLETRRFVQGSQVQQSRESGNGWMVWESEDHVEWLGGFFVATLGPLKGSVAIVMEEAQDALVPIHDLRNKIAAIGLVLFCAIFFVSHAVAKHLSRPINVLTMSAEAIAAGNFSTEMLPLQRQDEIGSLARAFKQMTGELKKLTEDLEQRVRERTAALAEAHRVLLSQIHERQAAEAAVRTSEQRFHQMVSRVKDYAIVMLDPKGIVLDWNDGAEHITGYRADEIVGKTVCCFYTEEDLRTGHPAQLLAQAVEQGSATDEGWRVRRDGSRFWAYSVLTAIHDEQGELIGFSKVTRDLTAQKEAETEKDKLRAQFLQAQKMEAVGQLAGGIAHDFNNLLTVITGYSQMAMMGLQPDEPRFLHIREISVAADRAANLTKQILAFSRKQVLRPTILSLNQIVGETEALMRPLIGEQIRLELVYAGDLESTKADRGQIQQIIMNLVVNARDAMPKGGRLMIRTGMVEVTQSRPETTGIVSVGRYVMLEVRDTGCGMDSATKARVFEPFFTTKDVGKGTGLGLSTVYGIAKQSNGYITVESEPGQGASFTLYLPVAKASLANPVPVEASLSEPVHETDGVTILLVEDEGNIRRLLQGLLASKGYNVLTAPDGKAGLVLGNSFSGRIDLLVTDVVMPKMSGADMAKQLQEKHEGLKVLYMSGYADESIVQHGVLEPGIAFLSKPFKPQVLLDRVAHVLQVNPMKHVDG